MDRESRENPRQERSAPERPGSTGKEQQTGGRPSEETAAQGKSERITPRILAEQAMKRRRAQRGT